MNRKKRSAARLLAHAPWLFVTLVGLALLWPAPAGHMPLSADHTVHLTRIWMFADVLSQGHVRGWSDAWFFGTPIGELYPVLGDFLVIAVRVLSLGLLDWPQSYAIGFSIAFLVPAWAMLAVGRTLKLGPLPGLIAALLILVDAGAYREGGWIYTVDYGVWPQHLATGLSWLGMSELCVACTSEDPARLRRRLGTAGLSIGAALLAHPMTLPVVAIGAVLLVIVVGLRPRTQLSRVTAIAGIGIALGFFVAAWWLAPMLAHRAWMASYGWTWQPLARMADEAWHGRWTQHMPAAVGATIALGVVLAAVRGDKTLRFFVAYAMLLWAFASQDALWQLRLDRLSAGFLHVQYQRFVAAAKPGLFVAAGAAIGILVHDARRLWTHPRRSIARPIAIAIAGGAIAATLAMVQGQHAAMAEHRVGSIQVTRSFEPSDLDEDYPALVAWLRDRWAERGDAFYRMTVVAPRNLHWFMDATVLSGMPLYKQGFVPGDNFVHKPESGKEALLDHARVRYLVVPQGRGGRGREVARFGSLRVLERPDWETRSIAWLQGAGTVEILQADPDGGPIRVRVEGTDADSVLVFAFAGYPRWHATQDGQELAWIEVPIVGDAPSATPDARQRGELRGGKALGDDGSEPTLFAVPVRDGEVHVQYERRSARDVIAGLVSWIAIGLCIALAGPLARLPRLTDRVARVVDRVARWLHPLVLATLVVLALALAAWRWHAGAREESQRAVGWALDGRAHIVGARAGLIKTDMLIRPAIVVHRRRRRPAELVLPAVTLGPSLPAWFAIDDDAAQLPRRGTHHVRIVAVAEDGETEIMPARMVAHRPGRTVLTLDTSALAGRTVDLRVTVDSEGEAPPPLGLDLDLASAEGS